MPRDYRANGKRAKWDWTPEQDKDLLSVEIQPWTERYRGAPSCFSEVAAKYDRTISACFTRYYKLRGKLRGQWTQEGLWSREEDALILAQLPRGGGRVANGTWEHVSEILTDRTVAAICTRACNLKRQLWGKRGGGA